MNIDHTLTATIMITVEEFLEEPLIALTALGRAALIRVSQSNIHFIDFQRTASNKYCLDCISQAPLI